MAIDRIPLSRRDLLRVGALWAGAGAVTGAGAAEPSPPPVGALPTRPFGRGGDRVSILGLGGYFDPAHGKDLLPLAFGLGVRYWEVTLAKGGRAHGAHFAAHPSHRAQVFLLGKARRPEPAEMDRDLARLLEDARTHYVDFFVVQGIADPAALHDELRVWAERQKAAGRIRYFGFTTHANMAPCLERAAGLAWIDGVVTAYNYRLMELADMRAAVDACAASGVALTAIKTQALPTNPAAEIGAESGAALDRLKRAAGGDPGAAKLRAVWSDPAVSSALSLMDAPLLRRNGDAARRPRLAATEAQALGERAQAESSWCAGCTRFCEARAPAGVPIGRILRALVYARGYGDLRRGRDILRDLPEAQRAALAHADYGAAERACPRGIAIGERMREAHARLA